MNDLLDLCEVLLVKLVVLSLDGSNTILKSSHRGKEIRYLLRRNRRWVILYLVIVIIVVVINLKRDIGKRCLLLIGYVINRNLS